MADGHNYIRKVNRLVASGDLVIPKGGLANLDIKHARDCAIFRNGFCNCDPDIECRAHTGEGAAVRFVKDYEKFQKRAKESRENLE